MHRRAGMGLFALAAIAAAACVGPNGIGLQEGGAGGSSSSSSSSSSGSTGGLSCAQVDEGVGCCDDTGAVRFCTSTDTTPRTTACAAGTACGWNATSKWYECVPAPGSAEPSGKYPMACSAVGTSSSSSSSSSSGGTATTWTELYDGVFGPSGTASCAPGGGCHSATISGFKCGTDKTTCYNGLVASSLVTPGAGALSSWIVGAGSPLCGSLGGNMPKGGGCITATELGQLKSWLGAGAPNN